MLPAVLLKMPRAMRALVAACIVFIVVTVGLGETRAALLVAAVCALTLLMQPGYGPRSGTSRWGTAATRSRR